MWYQVKLCRKDAENESADLERSKQVEHCQLVQSFEDDSYLRLSYFCVESTDVDDNRFAAHHTL